MTKIEHIYDITTGETTIVEREENEQEVAERIALEAINATQQAEQQAKIAARQAVLDKLGLTAEEAAVLLA
jgi:hypothetical protein